MPSLRDDQQGSARNYWPRCRASVKSPARICRRMHVNKTSCTLFVIPSLSVPPNGIHDRFLSPRRLAPWPSQAETVSPVNHCPYAIGKADVAVTSVSSVVQHYMLPANAVLQAVKAGSAGSPHARLMSSKPAESDLVITKATILHPLPGTIGLPYEAQATSIAAVLIS